MDFIQMGLNVIQPATEATEKVWEQAQDWSNPFGASEALEQERRDERKKRKDKKKKRVIRRNRMAEEEYTEMSSKADTVLDEILGEEEVLATRGMPGQSSNPFDDAEDPTEGNEIDQEAYAALMSGGNNEDDASTLPKGTNPFEEDDSIQCSEALSEEPAIGHSYIQVKAPAAQMDDLKRQPTESTQEQGESDSAPSLLEEEEEDVVESSKRLLRMVDERMQYQHYHDEIRNLKGTIVGMKHQAEAMSEQLRRAVETKCDLVLAQNEMERCHEQNLIAKDDEVRDMKKYVQLVLDSQAENEIGYINEISKLSKQLENMKAKHEKEMAAKNQSIKQLEAMLKLTQSSESIRGRFIDGTSHYTGQSPQEAIPVV